MTRAGHPNLRFFFILVLIILNLAISFSSFNYSFLNDDNILIKNSERVKNLSNYVSTLFKPFFNLPYTQNLQYWRPVVTLSFFIDYQINGDVPGGYHVTNVIFAIFTAVLIFYLIVLLTGSELKGFLSALLFSVHPYHAENVSWISGRTDLLLMIFFLLSFIFLAHFMVGEKRSYMFFSLLFFCLALLSKETAILIPVFFLVFFFKIFREKRSILLSLGIPASVLTLLYIYAHNMITSSGHLLGTAGDFPGIIVDLLKSFILYIKFIFLPFSPGPYYSMVDFDRGTGIYIIWFLIFFLLLFFIIRKREHFKLTIRFSPLLIFLTPLLFPGIISSYPQVSTRFVFVPSLLSALFFTEFFLYLISIKLKSAAYIFLILISIFSVTEYVYFESFFSNDIHWTLSLGKIYPNDADFVRRSATYFALRGENEKALNLIDEAIRKNRGNRWLNISGSLKIVKATLLLRLNRREESLALAESIFKKSGDRYIKFSAMRLISQYYELIGDYETAVKKLMEALENVDDSAVRRRLKKLKSMTEEKRSSLK